jgi:glycosyltransferase involved in cell wall biosynthesis
MRILEVFQPPAGGVAEHVRLLSRGIAARAAEVVVAGPADAQPRADIERHGIRYVALPIVAEMLDRPRDQASWRAILTLLREEDFDLVHCHGQKAGLLVRTAAPLSRTPVVHTPNGLLYRAGVEVTDSPRSGRLKTLWMERVLGRSTAALVGVCREERDSAVADHLVPARRAHVIYNGVDIDASVLADPALLAFRGDGPLIGFLAGLRDQKGLPLLLDALDLLREQGRAPRVAIVGDGPMRDLVAQRLRGPLGETTTLAPFPGRVEPALHAFDVYVLPSLWEGFSLAICEAMAAGRPVVASAVGGTPEAVIDGETGFLVPRGDVPELAAAIARIAQDAELRARLGAAGRARYEAMFTAAGMVDRTHSLYESVLARGRRARPLTDPR